MKVEGERAYTLFAPNNNAFRNFESSGGSLLVTEDILLTQLSIGEVRTNELVCGAKIKMLNNQPTFTGCKLRRLSSSETKEEKEIEIGVAVAVGNDVDYVNDNNNNNNNSNNNNNNVSDNNKQQQQRSLQRTKNNDNDNNKQKNSNEQKFQIGEGNTPSNDPQIVPGNANIQATNGIIHEIGAIILPKRNFRQRSVR